METFVDKCKAVHKQKIDTTKNYLILGNKMS